MSKIRKIIGASLGLALVLAIIGTVGMNTRDSVKDKPIASRIALSTTTVTTQDRCRAAKNLTDYQMNECLVTEVALVNRKLKLALRNEARHLLSSTISQAQQVVDIAESSFDRYVRSECLAEANPYTGGTIYPIVYGFCEVSLYQQRLTLVKRETNQNLGQ